MNNLTLLILSTVMWSSVALPSVRDTGSHADAVRVILSLQPALTEKQADDLSRIFRSEAAAVGLDWRLLVSIAFNESSLGKHKHNPKSKDFGVMQINERMIRKFGYDPTAVMHNDRLSVRLAARILVFNRATYAKTRSYWVGVYRSGTALHRPEIRSNAQSYDRVIRNTMKEIENVRKAYAQTENSY